MRVFRAPGRVNLIGDHTDYSEGFVMPMAIQLETIVTTTARPDRQLIVKTNDHEGGVAEVTVDLESTLRPRQDWSDYVIGVAHVLGSEECDIAGAELSVASTVPQGAGLSSSAALEVASAFALLLGDIPDRVQVAQWCQRAENEFVGARCGIMDQYVACMGQRGHALVIDCRTLQSRCVPIPDDVAIVVCNSLVEHSVAGGEYNTRRAQCEDAVKQLQQAMPSVRTLRDVTFTDLARHGDALSAVTLKRARHVVSENTRVQDAADAFARMDLTSVGELMRASHASLRDDFEVSVPEIDLLVDIANEVPGVFGSRMTGGGFGGCTVTLAKSDAAERVTSHIRQRYAAETGVTPQVIICAPSDGASELT